MFLKIYNYAYFKGVTNLLLQIVALLLMHHAKNQDTPIERSFIRIYQQINGLAM